MYWFCAPGTLELYVDTNRKTYSDLGYRQFNYSQVFCALLEASTRAAMSRVRALGIGGDLRGNGLQNGGALVIAPGGKLLFSYRQETLAGHVDPKDVLHSLNISIEELEKV